MSAEAGGEEDLARVGGRGERDGDEREHEKRRVVRRLRAQSLLKTAHSGVRIRLVADQAPSLPIQFSVSRSRMQEKIVSAV